jgi:hypothetical protein
VLGRLFTMDSLRLTPLRDGTTAVTLGIRLHPDRAKATHSALAKFVEKYLSPSRYHFSLDDRRTNSRYLDAVARDELLVFRLRTQNGHLLPLAGPARAMPDSLELRVELAVKFLWFHVGAKDVVADFAFLDGDAAGAHERGWLMRFRTEPDWDFPPLAERLVRAPLRRPFEGGGAVLRIAVRDSVGQQTLLSRRVVFAVRESAIMRWLGSLGAGALDDLAGTSEREAQRYVSEVWAAVRADARARADAQVEREVAQARMVYEMYNVLTAEQKAQLQAARQQREQRRQEFRTRRGAPQTQLQ